jgi:hypothetical protein
MCTKGWGNENEGHRRRRDEERGNTGDEIGQTRKGSEWRESGAKDTKKRVGCDC